MASVAEAATGKAKRKATAKVIRKSTAKASVWRLNNEDNSTLYIYEIS